jgi:anti-sigma-K factor RskA
MTELDHIDAAAAEYVLGTLTLEERQAVEARLPSEPALRKAIATWESHLTPLTDTIRPVSPPANLYAKVRAQIGLSSHVISLKTREQQLVRRGNQWRNFGAGMTALAASLAGVIGFQTLQPVQSPTQFVAVLQSADDQPAFLMTIDTKTHNCVITAVKAPKQANKSYQVWMVHDKMPKPKSLGVMAEGEMNVMPMASASAEENAMFMNANFAVSLEPEGGSPGDGPTGPVLFQGKLIQATP